MRRVITLITDFGENEHCAGTMKGAILSINPDVSIIDITHRIEPFNIMEGALVLKSSYCYFPSTTIHVVVIDPGVGGPRRALLIVSEKYLFVGPDNGVFSFVLEELENYTCYELTAQHYFRKGISPTFHGRDVFAPVAAWLTKRSNFEYFGHVIDNPVRLPIPKATVSADGIEGQVLHIDRFGNIITNISREFLRENLIGSSLTFHLGNGTDVFMPWKSFYGEVEIGKPCAVIGSNGFLELAVNQGQAAQLFNARIGLKVSLDPG